MEENGNIIKRDDLIDGYLVCIDLSYIPNGWSLEDEIRYIKEQHIAILDSSKVQHREGYSAPVELKRLEPSLVGNGDVNISVGGSPVEGLF